MTKETCPHCGAAAQPGATHCAVCGASLSQAPTPGAPQSASATGAPGVASASTAYGAATTAPQTFAPPAAAASPAPGAYPYPTYPAYPAPYAYPAVYGGYAPYGYYGYYGAYYPAPYAQPRRAPGETYALVVSWIVTALSGISILLGLAAGAIALITLAIGVDEGLAGWGAALEFVFAPLAGGGLGLWFGIRGILRRPSPKFQLPPAWAALGLMVVALVGSVGIWSFDLNLGRSAGAPIAVTPLAFMAGALPALAILAFATQRLGDPSTRRHVWMSLIYGATLAPLIAVILETILTIAIIAALGLTSSEANSLLSNGGAGGTSLTFAFAELLVLSVVAPLVEEGLKPLGALLIMRRLRTPAEAFLVGLAGGIGFDIFETIGYITQGQSDWITVALERVGAGLLHGVGAGMGALGWYYLVNGKGVSLRWLRAIGCFAYALLQHGTFNAFSLIGPPLLPLPQTTMQWLFGEAFYIGPLPLAHIDLLYIFIYGFILTVLVVMTLRLRHAKGMAPLPQPQAPVPVGSYPYPAPYAPYGGYAPYAAYPPYPVYPAIPWGYGLAQQPAASQTPQEALTPQTPQTPGGAQ